MFANAHSLLIIIIISEKTAIYSRNEHSSNMYSKPFQNNAMFDGITYIFITSYLLPY